MQETGRKEQKSCKERPSALCCWREFSFCSGGTLQEVLVGATGDKKALAKYHGGHHTRCPRKPGNLATLQTQSNTVLTYLNGGTVGFSKLAPNGQKKQKNTTTALKATAIVNSAGYNMEKLCLLGGTDMVSDFISNLCKDLDEKRKATGPGGKYENFSKNKKVPPYIAFVVSQTTESW